MRVLLVGTGIQPIPPTGYGGVERTIAEYANALRAAGHDPVVLQRVRRRRSLDEYWFARELSGLLRREEYDVLHASTPVVANRLAMLRRPFVYTSHSRHWFERDRWGARWGYFLERRAVRGSAATVALTERLNAEMRRTVRPPIPELRTIPIGVDLGRFAPDPSHRDGRTVLGVGVVAPFKRWEIAAAALRGTGARLRLVGPVPDPGYAERVRSAGESVEIVGEVDDETLRREFSRADLLIHPSRVELLAGVVLQALSSGLPVIGGPAIAGLPVDGESGFVLGGSDSDAELGRFLQDRAHRLLEDRELRERMGRAARERAASAFSWPSVVDRHVALYRELAESGRLTRR